MRDGGQITFRAVRFAAESVTLLLDDGTRTIPFSEIAELHLEPGDSWGAYFDELCQLSPRGRSRLLQVETVSGLVATASLSRFDARVRGDFQDSGHWLHGLQPAWSMDMLWLRNAEIRCRRSFAPHEVPLARIRPSTESQRLEVGKTSWPWRLNQNALGGPLRSGGKTFGWGFGVHGANELRFALPRSAVSLESWVGLDHVVGRGGCAVASVLLDDSADRPLYESPLLVGSNEFAASGSVSLASRRSAAAKLILKVDSAHQERPAGADPWEIRDFVDWGDPLVTLDREGLRQELNRQLVDQIAAWDGWDVQFDAQQVHGVNVASNTSGDRGGFAYAVAVHSSPLKLTRQVILGPSDRWLVINAAAAQGSTDMPRIEVHIDGRRIIERPLRVAAGRPADDEPLAVPLAEFRREVAHKIEIRQPAAPGSVPFLWRGIHISQQHPSLFRVLEDELPDTAEGVVEDKYSGRQCLRLPAGQQVELAVSGPIRIREAAQPGEYRFVRFAFRQQGQGGPAARAASSRIARRAAGAGRRL